MATAPGLSLHITDKRLGAGPALFAEFALEVAPGSVVALVGPSGVGKSSLLRIIAGLDRDFSGRIAIGGIAPQDAAPAGLVFQDARLFPWLSAFDNVHIANPGLSREAVLGLLAEVGLADRAEAWPHELSGGMQRRVALARALAVGSGVLLLDEPFVSLDRGLVAEMQQLIGRLIAEARPTTVLVSHLAEDAARLADRVVVLAGRPASIIADVVLAPARAQRTQDDVARLTREIEQLAEGSGKSGAAGQD